MRHAVKAAAPDNPHPERTPEFTRRVVWERTSVAGLLVLVSVPVLAMLGVLGDGKAAHEADAGELHVRMEAPVCARFGNPVALRLAATGGAAPGRRLTVTVSNDYLASFGDARAPIAPSRVTTATAVFERELAADGSGALIVMELSPQRYGWARGRVRASLDEGGGVEFPLKTFIFP